MKFFVLLYIFLSLIIGFELKPEGALLKVDFKGRVGFLLDEIPEVLRKDVINFVRFKVTNKQWRERAELQIKHTIYRQVFRENYFDDGRLQLTLSPLDVWNIVFTSVPFTTFINGHRYVVRDYKFNTVVIGDASTVNASEPLLNKIGGSFSDLFSVPADPEHVFQRIGYACADESSFPLDTVNSENVWTYHDQECEVEPFMPIENRTYEDNLNNCHWTSFPNKTCIQALKEDIGLIRLNITWTRVKYDEGLANKFRYGTQTSPHADIVGVHSKLEDEINIGYKYFPENSCTLEEGGNEFQNGCIGGSGWRQLLRFTSSSINIGKSTLELGDVYNPEYLTRGIYEFSQCHLHYHFSHYENYKLGNIPGSKTGFCLQTTWRYHNNEFVPFNTPYGSCTFQGISVGWGDDYYQGLDCQWIDVTDVKAGKHNLEIIANPDDFLCEGQFDLNPNGTHKWIKTKFLTEDGRPVYRQSCQFTKGYNKNNIEELNVNFRGRSETLVTTPCKREATISATKDCGFRLLRDNLKCQPNKTKTIRVTNNHAQNAAVVRLCESSVKLGHSTYCEYINKLSNVLVLPKQTVTVSFDCPSRRDAQEPGGSYSILVSNLIPDQKIPDLTLNNL